MLLCYIHIPVGDSITSKKTYKLYEHVYQETHRRSNLLPIASKTENKLTEAVSKTYKTKAEAFDHGYF